MEISFGRITMMLFKHIIAIILCAVIGLVLVFSATKYFETPTYQSSVKMWIEVERENPTSAELLSDTNLLIKRMTSYIEILKSNAFNNRLTEQSGLSYSSSQLSSMLRYSFEENTQSFTIISNAPNATDAKILADTAAALAPQYINETVSENLVIKALGDATLPSSPINSSTFKNSLLGFICGMLLAALFFTIREIMDSTIKSKNELEKQYSIPVLGTIPEFNVKSKRKSGIRIKH